MCLDFLGVPASEINQTIGCSRMLKLTIALNGYGITSKVELDVANGFEFDVLLSTEKLLNLGVGGPEILGSGGKDMPRSFLEKVREMKAAAASFVIVPPIVPPFMTTGSSVGKGRIPRRQNTTGTDSTGTASQSLDGCGHEVRPPPGSRTPGGRRFVSGNFPRAAKEGSSPSVASRSMTSPIEALLCKTHSDPEDHDLVDMACDLPLLHSKPLPKAPATPAKAPVSFIRRRLLGHRELAVAALAELPPLHSDSEDGSSNADDSGQDSESDCSDCD